MNAHSEQPPLFTEGNRPYSPKTEADELRLAILEHAGQALQRTGEPEGALCPRCARQLRALASVGPQPIHAYCRCCLRRTEVRS